MNGSIRINYRTLKKNKTLPKQSQEKGFPTYTWNFSIMLKTNKSEEELENLKINKVIF